jgi:hypothetical protein
MIMDILEVIETNWVRLDVDTKNSDDVILVPPAK